MRIQRILTLAILFTLHALSGSARAQDESEARSSGAQSARPHPRLERVAELILDGDSPALSRELRLWVEGVRGVDEPGEHRALEAALALTSISLGEPFAGAAEAWFGQITAPASSHSLAARLAWLRGDVTEFFPLGQWQVAGPFDNERGRGMRRRTPAERNPLAGPYEGKGAADDIRWRSIPQPGPQGVMPVYRLFHEQTQICYLARTWIRVSEASSAVLLLGASEEVRVWHQGQHVFDALDAHAFGFDSQAVRLELEPGWNELVLKVGGEDKPPTFVARLVDPETAEPLSHETSAGVPEGVEPRRLAAPRGSSGVAGTTVPPGARAQVAGATDAPDVLIRALLEARAESAPRKQRPGFDDARAAHGAMPESAAAALAHLMTHRVVEALDIEEDVNPWLDVLRAAIETHGDRFALLRDYALHAADSQGRVDRALALADRALKAAPDSIPARALRIGLLEQLGQPRAAEFEARALAKDPALDAHVEHALRVALWLDADEPERVRILSAARDLGATVPSDIEASAAAIRSEEAQIGELVERCSRAVQSDPYDIGARVAVARAFIAMGESRRALGYLDEAASLAPNRTDVNVWRARALALLGDDAGALESLDVLLRFDASATDEARFAEFLRGRLGTAEPAASFADRYRVPIETILAEAGPMGEGAPREVLHRTLVIDAGADGTARRFGRMVERILTPAGARELDRIPFRAFPGDEEVRVLSARVLRPDGSEITGRTGRTGGRGLFVLDLPPLSVGDVVDIEWRRDDLSATIFGDYLGIDVPMRSDSRLPVVSSSIVLLEPAGLDLATHMTSTPDGVERSQRTLEDGTRETRWAMGGIAPRRREHLEPPSIELEPRVQASTYSSWTAFGDWWWNLISEEITSSEDIRAKVAELTLGAETPLDRLRAIYDFVVTDVRYNAWEFGVHGYQPYSAAVIFSRRFGDCKDKAILMKTMLAEVGIEAWPVVIKADGRRYEEDLSLAMVGHFNHCIAYIPEQDGIPEMFLDGTARHHPLEVLPDSDRGAQVVVVREDGVEQRRVPFPEASENTMIDRTVIDMTEEGAATVELVQRPSGRWDPMLRSAYGGDAKASAAAVERTLTRRFGAVLDEPIAVHPDYEDLTSSFEVKIVAQVAEVGRPSDAGLEIAVSLVPDEMLARVASETARETDLLLGMPWVAERRLVYRLPAGSRVLDLPGAVEFRNEDLAYSRTISAVPAEDAEGEAIEVIVEERMQQRTHRVPASRYAEFRDAAREIDRAQDEVIQVEVNR